VVDDVAPDMMVAFPTRPKCGDGSWRSRQVALKNWKAAGIETDLRLKEYGAFIASTVFGKFDQMMVGLRGSWRDPHSYLQRAYFGSARVVSAWEPYVRNWAPNNGFDHGGRLMAAWLDR
jgi:hypothetical protein